MDTKEKTRRLDKELSKRFSYEGFKPAPARKARQKLLLQKLKVPLITLFLGIALSAGVNWLFPEIYNEGHVLFRMALAIPMMAGMFGVFDAFAHSSREHDRGLSAERRRFAQLQVPKISSWVNENFPLMLDPDTPENLKAKKPYTFGYEEEILRALHFEASKREKGTETGFMKMLYKNRHSEEELSTEERYRASGCISLGFIAHENELEVTIKEFTYIYN